jgi:hypothetical protein
MEIWKDIPNYEGLYQVSDLGRVKSLERELWNGKSFFIKKESILLGSIDKKGYLTVCLYLDKRRRYFKVHQLVAMVFLDHKPCGMNTVVHHKDENRLNNNVKNLELTSNRDNISKTKRGSSKYTGVYFDKQHKKWRSEITINKKKIFLGYYDFEEDASTS